jgi:hypothetical protein
VILKNIVKCQFEVGAKRKIPEALIDNSPASLRSRRKTDKYAASAKI